MTSVPLEFAQQLIRLRSIALLRTLDPIKSIYRQVLERLLLPA